MLQPCGELDLTLEPLRTHRLGDLGVENLEGHGPVMPQILRQVHYGKAAATQFTQERKAVNECSGEDVAVYLGLQSG